MTEQSVRTTLEEYGLHIAAPNGMLASRAYTSLMVALHRLQIEFMVDEDDTGAVIFLTEDSRQVICAVSGTMDGQGEVNKFGNDYIVSLSIGLLSTLLDFTGSAWANDKLLRAAQDCSRSMQELYPPILPGFERFLLRRVPANGDRHAVPFVSAFSAATEFCWLHELSHVFLGHCDSVEGSISMLGSNDASAQINSSSSGKKPGDTDTDTDTDTDNNSIPRIYMEMQADEFALNQVMISAYRDYLSKRADDIRVFAAYIGCLALPVTCYVEEEMNRATVNEINSKNNLDIATHPPFYIRASMGRRAAYQTLEKAFKNASQRDLVNHRERYERFNEKALRVLSHRHPWYDDFSRALTDEANCYLEWYIKEQGSLAATWIHRFRQNIVAPRKLSHLKDGARGTCS